MGVTLMGAFKTGRGAISNYADGAIEAASVLTILPNA
jgi:hypothetical protein